ELEHAASLPGAIRRLAAGLRAGLGRQFEYSAVLAVSWRPCGVDRRDLGHPQSGGGRRHRAWLPREEVPGWVAGGFGSSPPAHWRWSPPWRRCRARGSREGKKGPAWFNCAGIRSTKKGTGEPRRRDRKSTRLNSSHVKISYAVFCLTKKNRY